MEGTRKWKKGSFSAILLAITAILLCALPCKALNIEEPVTIPSDALPGPVNENVNVLSGGTLNLLAGGQINGTVTVYDGGTLNLWPGADISLFLFAKGGSKVNIYGGDIGMYVLVADETPLPVVTVYGTDFKVDNVAPLVNPVAINDYLTGFYVGEPEMFTLWILSGNIPIYLGAPVEQLIEQLIDDVEDLNLKQGIDNSLDAKLQNALEALEAANAGQRQDAVNKIQAFISAVEAQSSKAILEADANALIGSALLIIDLLLAG